jgi:REP element-mobilizing transposase RayT
MGKDMSTERPRGRQLRAGRASLSGNAYHVIFRTFRGRPLFHDLRLGRIVVDGLRCQHEARRASTLAFVVMPDHVHWLFVLGACVTLPGVMSAVKGSTAWRINSARGAIGERVWQAGYFDHAVRRDEEARAIARYIVANPLRAGLVATVGDYPLWDACWV